jgi:single-strand DNA-binding protein
MALGDAQIRIIGTVMDDPNMRYTPGGKAVAKIRVLTSPREKDRQTGEWKNMPGTSYFVTCFDKMAENVGESCGKGTRVVIDGTIREREYEQDGVKKYAWDVTADEVSLSLRWDAAKVQRMDRASKGQVATGTEDAWATR